MSSKATAPTFSPAADIEGVSDQQRQEIKAQSRPNAALIHETIRAEGESELERRWWAILLSGLAAGLSMSLSLIVQGEFHAFVSDESVRRLFAPLGYTAGFLVVVLGRQQLFTENTLTPILPLLHHRDLKTLGQVARLWGLVLTANVVGTWAAAAALAHTDVFEPRIIDAFTEISRHTIDGPFSTTFMRAIFAGWLIALMAWLLPAIRSARPHIVIIMTYLVALGQFAHIVAGSVECAFLVLKGEASLADYVGVFFVPTLLGNVVGGTTLVALLNYGQVAAELDQDS
ncbi:putative transport protein, yfdC-like [Bradyrhizobium sp. ORS 375]|uniref:formate/nitrite transporter family protein n=1 Tax=Bradyrhizobium sp. (strain ORS 375) TaxID=566679 RepID=UPI000240691D|nr:formate/nitrite transporter family protein [Bradyrhizobium sp. ORS 375]CCD93052.1 putative transport protein, yfdC-like [Bradyrhizobium sp. ORS 375]